MDFTEDIELKNLCHLINSHRLLEGTNSNIIIGNKINELYRIIKHRYNLYDDNDFNRFFNNNNIEPNYLKDIIGINKIEIISEFYNEQNIKDIDINKNKKLFKNYINNDNFTRIKRKRNKKKNISILMLQQYVRTKNMGTKDMFIDNLKNKVDKALEKYKELKDDKSKKEYNKIRQQYYRTKSNIDKYENKKNTFNKLLLNNPEDNLPKIPKTNKTSFLNNKIYKKTSKIISQKHYIYNKVNKINFRVLYGDIYCKIQDNFVGERKKCLIL
jgi:hypothetical protein